MKAASSDASHSAAFAMSNGLERRPSGIDARNFSRISGVSSPMKRSSIPVSPATGHRQFALMFFGASSTAMDLVAVIAQPFEALYQVSPGRGRSPAVEAVVRITPPPNSAMIGATVPLGDDSPVLPGGESVDDSRFVVRYFRRSIDGRLLFGGREVYTADNPKDIAIHIRRQIAEIYPSLKDVEITHAWGGYVGITMPRKPFIREVMPNVISAGGYSGHGVMLSNFVGKLYAETISGNRDRLKLFEDLRIPPFPGGRRFRAPLLFLALNWYALRDRI